jgi:hypothetical protein
MLHHKNWETTNRWSTKQQWKLLLLPMTCVLLLVLILGGFWFYFAHQVVFGGTESSSSSNYPWSLSLLRKKRGLRYVDYREIAVQLAQNSPKEALVILRSTDPFGTRRVLEKMEEATADGTKDFTLSDLKRIFPCPANDRISLPDQRNHAISQRFRGDPKTGFILFQHLRKAGGTNFCTLAEANLPKRMLPEYYCMPDYHWPQPENHQDGHKCAGCLQSYTNEQILNYMKHHKIAGNEWQSFQQRFFDLPAVLTTSFRDPLARAISQFRFECIENRGCNLQDIGIWWKRRRDLYNVYTWTFSDVEGMGTLSTSNQPEHVERRTRAMKIAMDTVARFHLVLSMEYLKLSGGMVRDVLGFQDTAVLETPVRPHNEERKRSDSWKPRDYLNATMYELLSESLALDQILTDAAQRFFLERLVCDDIPS